VKIGRGVRQECCLSSILFNLYSECLTKETLEGFGDFKTGGQVIHPVKYADDLVLLAKEEKVLQDTIDKLTAIGGCYGMEMNVEKTKVMRISPRQPFPAKIMIDQKQLENVESFKYLGSILTNVEGVLVKLNVGLLWLKLHSTRRGIFLLAHWTWN